MDMEYAHQSIPLLLVFVFKTSGCYVISLTSDLEKNRMQAGLMEKDKGREEFCSVTPDMFFCKRAYLKAHVSSLFLFCHFQDWHAIFPNQ